MHTRRKTYKKPQTCKNTYKDTHKDTHKHTHTKIHIKTYMSQNAKGHKRIKLHSPQKIINYIHKGQRRHTKPRRMTDTQNTYR